MDGEQEFNDFFLVHFVYICSILGNLNANLHIKKQLIAF